MAADLLRTPLPYPWSYGVMRDGRVFFANDETRTTSWLHPAKLEPAQTGYIPSEDLPPGWELATTAEGIHYFIDHNSERTTFSHPITGERSAIDAQQRQIEREAEEAQRAQSQSPKATKKEKAESPKKKDVNRASMKRKNTKSRIVDRVPSVKRSEQSPVSIRGWLYKQESSGLKAWKKKWFVLADFCLFYYKGPEEGQTLGSILLPSYKINPCGSTDSISKKFAFKAEHQNMRTYYFAAESKPEMQRWMNAMSLATILQRDPNIEKQYNSPARKLLSEEDEAEAGFSPSSHNDSMISHGSSTQREPLRAVDNNNHQNPSPYSDRRAAPPGRDHGNHHPNMGNGHGDRPSSRHMDTPDPRIRPDSQAENQDGGGHPSGQQGFYNVRSREMGTEAPNGGFGPRPLYRDGYGSDQRSSMADSQQSDRRDRWADAHGSREQVPGEAPQRPLQRADAFGPDLGHGSVQREDSLQRLQEWHQQQVRAGQGQQIMEDPQNSSLRRNGHDNNTMELTHERSDSYSATMEYGKERYPREQGESERQPVQRQESLNRLREWQERMQNSQRPQNQSQQRPPEGSQVAPKQYQSTPPQSVFPPPQQQTQYPGQEYPGQQSPYPGQQSQYPGQQSPGQRSSYPGQRSSYPGQQSPGQRSSYPGQQSPYPGEQSQYPRERTLTPQDHGQYPKEGDQYPRDQDQYPGQPIQYAPLEIFTQDEAQLQSSPWQQQQQQQRSPDNKGSPRQKPNLSISPDAIFPLYENLPLIQTEDEEGAPGRPPLPAVYRDKLIRDLAETKTPQTRQDYLNSVNLSQERHMTEGFFDYPTPAPHLQKQQPISNKNKEYFPESYYDAKKKMSPEKQQQFGEAQRDSNHNLDKQAVPLQQQSPQQQQYQQQQYQQYNRDMNRQGQLMQRVQSPNRNSYPGVEAPQEPQVPTRANQKGSSPLRAVKEDPAMSDADVVEKNWRNLRKTHLLNMQNLRLSISASDLIGKSHEELVLLLIELRRDQNKLERLRDHYRELLSLHRPHEKEYKRKRSNSIGRLSEPVEEEHDQYLELKSLTEELEKKVDVHKPLVNLVDNLVTMGSLYGGDNAMLASQFKRHKLGPGEYTPPKRLVEFSRRLQEEKLVRNMQDDMKKLTEEEVELEEKLERLYQLDRSVQEYSFSVTNLKEDEELLQKAFEGVKAKLEVRKADPREYIRLQQQADIIEMELSKVRFQLADSSKRLEDTATEHARTEHEVLLLRKKISGDMGRSFSSPTLLPSTESSRAKLKLEQELSKVQSIMDGLSKQGSRLSEVMSTLRHSAGDLTADDAGKEKSKKKDNTYLETDLDRSVTVDLGTGAPFLMSPKSESKYNQYIQPTKALREEGDVLMEQYTEEGQTYQPRDISQADENMQRFYGIIPKEKPKVHTVRDVKREVQRRKDRERQRWSLSELSTEMPSEVLPSIQQPQYQEPPRSSSRGQQYLGVPSGSQPRRGESPQFLEVPSPSRHSRRDRHSSGAKERSKSLPRHLSGMGAPPSPKAERSSKDLINKKSATVQKRKMDRERRQSALERLFPSPGTSPMSTLSRTSSDRIYSPNSTLSRSGTSDYGYSPSSTLSRNNSDRYGEQYRTPQRETNNPENRTSPPQGSLGSRPSSVFGTTHTSATIAAVKPVVSEKYLPSSTSYTSHQMEPPRPPPPSNTALVKPITSVAPVAKNSFIHTTAKPWSGFSGNTSLSTSLPLPDTKPQDSSSSQPIISSVSSQPVPKRKESLGLYGPIPFGASSRSSISQAETVTMTTTQSPAAPLSRALSPTVTSKAQLVLSTPTKSEQEQYRKIKTSPRAMKGSSYRARHMTISSSQPVKLEQIKWGVEKTEQPSLAGDIITSQQLNRRQKDDQAIKDMEFLVGMVKEGIDIPEYMRGSVKTLQDNYEYDGEFDDVLHAPDKVEIPERYVASDSEEEQLTEEEKQARARKAEKVRKMLAVHSLQEFSRNEVAMTGSNIHNSVLEEKQRRENLLVIKHALAKEVTIKSKQQAVMHRKTWSGKVAAEEIERLKTLSKQRADREAEPPTRQQRESILK